MSEAPAQAESRPARPRAPLGVISAILVVVLAGTIAFVTVNYFQLSSMTNVSASIDGAQQELVFAYSGLMDANEGFDRFLIDGSPTSRANVVNGSASFVRHTAVIQTFTSQHQLLDASAATKALSAAFVRWHTKFAAAALQGRVRLRDIGAADVFADQAQAEMDRLDRALVDAREAQVNAVQRQGLISQACIGFAIMVLAAIGFAVDYRRRREQAASVALLELRAGALERSNGALQDFAYVASHDLQEPLRMVSSYTQLLARRYKGRLDADADEFIAYAVDGAKRMHVLIQDILEYSRVDAAGDTLLPVAVRDVFRAAVVNLDGAIAESSADVSSGTLPRAIGDQRQLAQLFQNVIGNALKYRGADVPRVRVTAEKDGDMLRFAIRDNGIGIAPEYFDRIFRMFQRLHAKSEYGGTGIGLAICKRIVERHGGRMWVASKPGTGSTFFFTLRAA